MNHRNRASGSRPARPPADSPDTPSINTLAATVGVEGRPTLKL